MGSDLDDSNKRSISWKLIAFAIVILVIFVMFFLLPFIARLKQRFVPQPPKLPPPDLSRCTRVEIRYYPSTLECFFITPEYLSLLSPEETKYLRSLETFIVDDPERLKAIAYNVSLGTYIGPTPAGIAARDTMHVVCYENSKRLTFFRLVGRDLLTEDMQCFEYSGNPLGDLQTLTPQIWPFYMRVSCTRNLGALWSKLHFRSRSSETYPKPTEWCDAILRVFRAQGYIEKGLKSEFNCPSAGKGKCHYAMNLNCEPNSPPDTVLLFETKAGWNQHGGPELFTFDNHDPRGGCVLLNDGTVKFIRTQEELHSLRWK